MTLNLPPTPASAAAINMTIEEAMRDERRASILAGRYLRMMGYERKYSHAAWNRGMRWFAPGTDFAMDDATNVSILNRALA